MPDGELGVTLRANFSSNLETMGRQFGAFSDKAKSYARDMREWFRATPADQMLAKHVRLGAQLQGLQKQMVGAKEEYLKWTEKAEVPGLSDKALKDAKRNADEANKIMVRLFQDQVRIKTQLEGPGGGGLPGPSGTVGARRLLRLGLGTLGLPLTIAAAGRMVGGVAGQQNQAMGLATRLRPLNEGFESFDEHVMKMRRNIVDAGAELAFSGRESLQLADSMSRISGQFPEMRATLEGARALGITPQQTGQLLAFSRRFGKDERSGTDDARLMNIVTRGIAETGMLPRSGEYIQTIVETMQQFATRMPSVDPGTIGSLVRELNATGIATLRGQGATTFMRGTTSMMDDMSEAMIAMQTEVMSNDPGLARRFAARNLPGVSGEDLQSGPGKYFALMALKQAGISDPDGLKLAGATIREMTRGQDKMTRMTIEMMLLRLSPTMVAALNDSGFMEKFLSGEISERRLRSEGDTISWRTNMAMQTPAAKWGRLGSVIGAGLANIAERNILDPTGDFAGAQAERLRAASERGGLSFMAELAYMGISLPGMAIIGAGKTALGIGRAIGRRISPGRSKFAYDAGKRFSSDDITYDSFGDAFAGTGIPGTESSKLQAGSHKYVVEIRLSLPERMGMESVVHAIQGNRQMQLASGDAIEVNINTSPQSAIVPPGADVYGVNE